jgi:hypothetical protein
MLSLQNEVHHIVYPKGNTNLSLVDGEFDLKVIKKLSLLRD